MISSLVHESFDPARSEVGMLPGLMVCFTNSGAIHLNTRSIEPRKSYTLDEKGRRRKYNEQEVFMLLEDAEGIAAACKGYEGHISDGVKIKVFEAFARWCGGERIFEGEILYQDVFAFLDSKGVIEISTHLKGLYKEPEDFHRVFETLSITLADLVRAIQACKKQDQEESALTDCNQIP